MFLTRPTFRVDGDGDIHGESQIGHGLKRRFSAAQGIDFVAMGSWCADSTVPDIIIELNAKNCD
jgi:hypothetical protein